MMTSIRLNLFQQVMALWEEVSPYNAGHAMQLDGRADFAALQEAIQQACREMGLGNLLLDRKGRSYSYQPAETIRLDRIGSEAPARQTLCDVLSEQMNSAFPDRPHHPIRWAVIDDPGADTHFLVAVSRHLIADAFSLRLLFRRVMAHYYGASQTVPQGPLTVHAPDYGRVMKQARRRAGCARTLFSSIRLYFRLRRVYRLPEPKDSANASRVLLFDAAAGLVYRLSRACRARRVSVNDAFLAALASAVAEITPARRAEHRRRGLALASAVDLRQAAAESLSHCLGLFISHWVTLIDDPESEDFETLLAEVNRQTRREKAEKRFAGLKWEFLAALLLRRWLAVAEDRSWYRKVYPLTAGLTNIRMDDPEFFGVQEKVLGCFFVPPTGPALPLTLCPLTLDDKLTLSVVYREGSLSEAQVRTVIGIFLERLESFSKMPRAAEP